jgi:hypothetical protein
VAALLALPDATVVSTDRRPSSTRASPSGALALFLTLEELGVPVGRRLTPLVGADTLPAVLALLAPTEPLSPREVGALVGRIRAGGALLYAASPPDALLDTLGVELVDWWEVRGRDTPPLWEPAGHRVRPWTVRAAPHRWTGGLEDIGEFDRAFVVTEERAGSEALLTDGDSLAFALVVPLGEGRVVAISDPRPLTNEAVRASGVAPLVVRAARELTAGGRRLVFDEYHHGLRGGSVREGLATFLARHPAGHVGLQLAAVGLLGLLVAARRFGSPQPVPGAPRRSPLEHVDALAQIYREARARRVPRLLLLAGLARRTHRPRPRNADEVLDLLRRLESAVPGAAAGVGELRSALEREDDELAAVSAAVDRVTEELRR